MKQAGFIKALAAGKPQHIVCYGCSLTEGGAWVWQMRDALNESYPGLVKLTNSGKGAMWSRWGVANLRERVLNKNPDVVFIEFSINDAFLEYKTSVAEARENLTYMIDRIRRRNSRAEVILMVMNPPIREHLERRPHFTDYTEMYRDVARERRLLLIDHHPNWDAVLRKGVENYLELVSDGIHPNETGYAKIVTPYILASIGFSAKTRVNTSLARESRARKTGKPCRTKAHGSRHGLK